MTKKEQKRKLAVAIAGIDAILLAEGEDTAGSPVLRKCRTDLAKLYRKVSQRRSKISAHAIAFAIKLASEVLYHWVSKLLK